MKLCFQSIEEIERIKRDFNIYKQTQRNKLGIAKTTDSSAQKGNKNKFNWIDLFNIGNVMLMRGQDIQSPFRGWNEICEHDDIDFII